MTNQTIVAQPEHPAPPPARVTGGDWVRFVLRGIGQTLITLGLIVLLFVVYEVWITNLFAQQLQSNLADALKTEWQNGGDPLLPLPGEKNPAVPIGAGIAVMYIPRLGRDFHFTIVEGHVTPDDADLEKGPAHYHDTALPGQVGNFAVAGHRVGKGEPFLNLDQLQSGDAVIVETKSYWYIYRVLGEPRGKDPSTVTQQVDDIDATGRPSTVQLPGREIVTPDDGNVLLPVPDHPEAGPRHQLMTMTTCHPKFTASHRMIVYATLVANPQNTDPNLMPPPIANLYNEVKV